MCFKPSATDNESQREDNTTTHFPILVFLAHIYDSYKNTKGQGGCTSTCTKFGASKTVI